MTKPEKNQLVRGLEEQFKSNEYSYHHKAASAFLIDVMAAIREVPVSGLSNFSYLLSKHTEIHDLYHHYGRIFSICNHYDNRSVKDTERLRRCSKPVVLSSVKLSTPDSQGHDNILTTKPKQSATRNTNLCFSCVKGLWNGMKSQCMSWIVSELVTKFVLLYPKILT